MAVQPKFDLTQIVDEIERLIDSYAGAVMTVTNQVTEISFQLGKLDDAYKRNSTTIEEYLRKKYSSGWDKLEFEYSEGVLRVTMTAKAVIKVEAE